MSRSELVARRPALPQELIYVILHTVYTTQDPLAEQQTLKACATVHSSFLGHCQRYLFTEVVIAVPSHRDVSSPAPTPAQRLHSTLVRSPHLADYVRALRIEERLTPVKKLYGEIEWGEPYGVSREAGSLAHLLRILPDLEHLAFIGHMRDRVLPDRLGQAFAIPPALHTLELAVVTVPLLLLQELHFLETLRTRAVRWIRYESETIPWSSEQSTTLRNLEVHESALPIMPLSSVDVLRSPLNLGALHSFSVTIAQDMAHAVQNILGLCRDTLTELEVWPTDSPTLAVKNVHMMFRLPLGELPRLRVLVIHSPTGVTADNNRSMWDWILGSLDSVRNAPEKSLRLTIDISYHSSHALGTKHFTQLDDVLARISPRLRSASSTPTGKLNWLSYAVNDVFTLVVPNGVSNGAAVGLYWEWTKDAAGNLKKNKLVNSTFRTVSSSGGKTKGTFDDG
ncbi:hypothetical protein HDZ31DRAFT_66473 [Schizophyllum fasciatum]